MNKLGNYIAAGAVSSGSVLVSTIAQHHETGELRREKLECVSDFKAADRGECMDIIEENTPFDFIFDSVKYVGLWMGAGAVLLTCNEVLQKRKPL